MHFQLLHSKVCVQMVPVNFFMKGNACFFFLTAKISLTPLRFPLVAINMQYWLYLSLERRHATNRKEL